MTFRDQTMPEGTDNESSDGGDTASEYIRVRNPAFAPVREKRRPQKGVRPDFTPILNESRSRLICDHAAKLPVGSVITYEDLAFLVQVNDFCEEGYPGISKAVFLLEEEHNRSLLNSRDRGGYIVISGYSMVLSANAEFLSAKRKMKKAQHRLRNINVARDMPNPDELKRWHRATDYCDSLLNVMPRWLTQKSNILVKRDRRMERMQATLDRQPKVIFPTTYPERFPESVGTKPE